MALYLGDELWDGRPIEVVIDTAGNMAPVKMPADIETAWTDEQLASFGLVRGDPPAEMVWAELRAERDRRLAASDYTQLPDAPVDAAVWAAYRQALRDLPDVTTDPAAPVWPVAPK